ncbi:MAG: hypothetical protein ACTHLO_15840 [Pseudolabrys sp.]
MRTIFLSGAAALALLSAPALSPAFAQDNVRSDKTVQPHELEAPKRAPLKVSDAQQAAIRDGLVAEHTQQKTPDGFKPQVGQALPKTMKVDVMPQDLTRREPSLKQYGYAKTASDILVLDPMSKKIIAVVPRKFPADAKAAESPVDWAKTKGRELTGQQPEQPNAEAQPLQPAGDSGDVKNGNESNAKEK